jgi:hypothetical protein
VQRPQLQRLWQTGSQSWPGSGVQIGSMWGEPDWHVGASPFLQVPSAAQ